MVTSKQLPASATLKPRRRGIGGIGFLFFLVIILAGGLSLAGIGIFAPARLAMPQERLLGLLHGGIADSYEESYVDGCVIVEGADGLRAVPRTRRITTFRDGTTIEVIFSDRPALTNACP